MNGLTLSACLYFSKIIFVINEKNYGFFFLVFDDTCSYLVFFRVVMQTEFLSVTEVEELSKIYESSAEALAKLTVESKTHCHDLVTTGVRTTTSNLTGWYHLR